ncbi:MAG: ABC transporter ATP-binding protein [Cyanobacteria bacterium J06623_4]
MRKRKRPKTLKQAFPKLQQVLKRFWPQIAKQKGLLTLAALALVAKVLARVIAPWPLKLIFDFVLVPDAHSADLDWPLLRELSTNMLLGILSLGIIATAVLRAVASYISLVGLSVAASRIIADIRADLYTHIQQLSLSFHYRSKSGDLVTRLTSDIDTLRSTTVDATLPLIVDTLTLVSMVGVMFWIDWKLALISTLVFPVFITSSFNITKKVRKVSRQQRRRESSMASTVAESIGAIKVVQALSLENRLEEIFARDNRQSLEDSAYTQQLTAGLKRTAEVLVAVATALVLWRGAVIVQQGNATPGDLLVFITYLKTAFKPTRDLAKEAAKISKAIASGERIIDIFDVIPKIQDKPQAIVAPAFKGDISYRNVCFGYDTNGPFDSSTNSSGSVNQEIVLKDINLEIKAGERVALVGPSGGGKSTLVSLLLRLYDPLSGSVRIDGKDLRDYQIASLRGQISIVLQDSMLFGTTVRDNIAYGTTGATDADIERAAKLANAHDFIMKLPQGYDTLMSERGSTLSGGQRQRIAIARAAVRKAPIVVLDEPTVGLDNKSERAVNDALAQLTQNATTFLITHDLRAAVNCDRIFYIKDGQILESGTHESLVRKDGHYAALYQIQQADTPASLISAQTSAQNSTRTPVQV